MGPFSREHLRAREQPLDIVMRYRWWNPQAFFADEDGSALAQFYREQEEGYVSGTLILTGLAPLVTWFPDPFPDEDPDIQMGYFPKEQEEGYICAPQILIGQAQSVTWFPVPFQDEDPDIDMAYFPKEQEEGYFSSGQTVTWTPVPVANEEAISVFVGEDDALIFRPQPILWSPQVFLDDEAEKLTNLGLDEELPIGTAPPVQWLAVPFIDDEASGSLAGFGMEDEPPWMGQAQPIVWLTATFSDEDTLSATTLLPFYRASNTVDNDLTPTSTIVLSLSGAVAGDVAPVQLDIQSTSVAITGVPSGWQLISSQINGSTFRSFYYWKTLTAADISGGTATWTLQGSVGNSGSIQFIGNADPTNPIAASASQANASSTSCQIPSVTPPQDNCLWLGLFSESGKGTWTAPGSPFSAIRFSTGTGPSGGSGQAGADAPAPLHGTATGTATATLSTSNLNNGMSILIRGSGGTFQVEEEGVPGLLQYQTVTWNAVPFFADEDGSSFTGFGLEQEEGYLSGTVNVGWTPVAFRDEDPSASLAYFVLEDEPPWNALRTNVTWAGAVFPDEEARLGVTPIALGDEDPVQTSILAVQWTAVSFLDEHAAPLFLIDDELGWTAPVQNVAWTPFAAQHAEEAMLPNVSVDDEAIFIPTAWPFQWIARPFLDEDPIEIPPIYEDDLAWGGMTQNVIWTARPFVDDFSLVQVVNPTGQIPWHLFFQIDVGQGATR